MTMKLLHVLAGSIAALTVCLPLSMANASEAAPVIGFSIDDLRVERWAREHGAGSATDGMGMLVEQAAEAFFASQFEIHILAQTEGYSNHQVKVEPFRNTIKFSICAGSSTGEQKNLKSLMNHFLKIHAFMLKAINLN